MEVVRKRSGTITANQNKKETHQTRLQKHLLTRNTWELWEQACLKEGLVRIELAKMGVLGALHLRDTKAHITI